MSTPRAKCVGYLLAGVSEGCGRQPQRPTLPGRSAGHGGMDFGRRTECAPGISDSQIHLGALGEGGIERAADRGCTLRTSLRPMFGLTVSDRPQKPRTDSVVCGLPAQDDRGERNSKAVVVVSAAAWIRRCVRRCLYAITGRTTWRRCTSAMGSGPRRASRQAFLGDLRAAGHSRAADVPTPFFRAIGGSALTDEKHRRP